jgi:Zn-dependent M28 family amino/carboxypeptidase
MRKILYLTALFIFTTTSFAQTQVKSNKLQKSRYKIDEKSIAQFLKTLSSDEFEGRESGTAGIEKAAVFLEQFFKQNNIKPYFSTYRDTLSNFEGVAYNIVGYLEGNDPILKNEFIVLGGHYDHIGISGDAKADKINNGANDDASGVTAVAAVAKYFATAKSNKRSILFCFFSGEEKGLLGSKHLAKKLKAKNLNLYTMLNFEMIGVPMKRDYLAYITGFDTSNMVNKLNDYSGRKLIGFLPKEAEYKLFSRSDNYPFYNEFEVPAQTVSTFDFENFDFYHHVDDEFDKMDTAHMTNFVQSFIPVVEKMANVATKEIVLKK